MTEAERVGQLFMVGAAVNEADPAALATIDTEHVGSVILVGSSRESIADIAAINSVFQSHAGRVGLFISSDQEGGLVQRMKGPGFSVIPSALEQSEIDPTVLQSEARQWGSQLAAAGINLDLAPVADTVTGPSQAAANPPIGQLNREYGYGIDSVTTHATAVAQGLSSGGVDATAKHFPGLGAVTANTDTSSGVIDHSTTRTSGGLAPFAQLIDGGIAFVMVSSAIYAEIDPSRPAAFSPTVVTGMLRGDLGFTGVVISDDVGKAVQLLGYSVGDRALDFIAAGGDMVLTIESSQIPAMTAAVLARAQADAVFAAQVDAAALRVLRAKQARGLLAPG